MVDYFNIHQPSSKGRVAPKYKPAKGSTGKGSFDNRGRTKPATKKKVNMVDKKVKRVSNKVMGVKGIANPGPAAYSTTQKGNHA